MSARSPVTTHVLELGTGRPAAGVAVRLTQITGLGHEKVLAEDETNQDGRLMDWFSAALVPGVYRLHFATGDWFQARGKEAFYPEITIDFRVSDLDTHYHVPLLLNQFGYSTYRGS